MPRSLSTMLYGATLLVMAELAFAQVASNTHLLATRKRDLLDRAVAAWDKVTTVRATFEQTIMNPLTGGLLRASGDYQQRRPGRLSVKFNNPASDRIVADGKYVWLYLPSSAPGQVIRTRLGRDGTGTVDLTAQFLSSPRSRFDVTEGGSLEVVGRQTHAYDLLPRSLRDSPFQRARVYIDDTDATIRQFVVTEASGVERTVRLTSLRTNVPVDASSFVFQIPAGVRVVEH